MHAWKQVPRGHRREDDKLWARFRAAQDVFFNARHEAEAAQDAVYAENLKVKEGLLEEARALLPVEDIEAAKAAFEKILDRWDAAGRVPRNDPDSRLGWLIIIGSLPIGILGLLLEDYIDTQFRSLWIVATMLIVFAVFLGLADRFGREQRELKDLTFRHGLLYGCAQALALVPGVSRSGGTITAGLFMGYTREAAARYSFLLAMPAVFMSGLYKTFKVVTGEEATGFYGIPSTIVATLVAFVVGYLMIGWFLKYVSSKSYGVFIWYRIALGILIFVGLGTGVLSATSSAF